VTKPFSVRELLARVHVQLRTIGVNNAKTTPEAQSGLARRVSRDLKIPLVYL